MEPNLYDIKNMSIDSLEASMAREILESSMQRLAEEEEERGPMLVEADESIREAGQVEANQVEADQVEAEIKPQDQQQQEQQPLDQEPKQPEQLEEPQQQQQQEQPEKEQDTTTTDDTTTTEGANLVETSTAAIATTKDDDDDQQDEKEEAEESEQEGLVCESGDLQLVKLDETCEEDKKEEDTKSSSHSREDIRDEQQQEHEEPPALPIETTKQGETEPHLLTFQTAAGGNSVLDQSTATNYMEFTKNYSDDLLMGQGSEAQQQASSGTMPPSADLADFELPPYSGSSSGSEPRQQSPVKQRKSSTSAQAPSSSSSSSHTSAPAAAAAASPPNLSAVKDLLMASYSQMSHVLQWKRPLETGVVFGIGATFIMALTFFSIISVVAYSALGLILTSTTMRLYKILMKTLNRSSETPFDHMWNKFLALDVSFSSDKLHELVDASHGHLNASLAYFKQVLLVEDKIATVKCGIFLYILTYIGAWFNGMTLITIGYLALFSVPILYQKNKTKIDEYLALITGQLSSTLGMMTSRVSSLAFGSSSSVSSGETKKKN